MIFVCLVFYSYNSRRYRLTKGRACASCKQVVLSYHNHKVHFDFSFVSCSGRNLTIPGN